MQATSSAASMPRSVRKMRLLPLLAATYFMVSGGPYGLEDIIGRGGLRRCVADPVSAAVCVEPCRPR